MALHYQPQRYRNTLHHYLTISLRRCRSPRDNNEDATLSPRQYHTHRKCLQSIRDRSRTFDDFLGSVSISFWFCKLHHSLTNWLPGPGLSSAQLDELLVLPVQRCDDDSQFLLRGGSRPWLDPLFTPECRPACPINQFKRP